MDSDNRILERIHLDRLNRYSESLASDKEESFIYECNDCGNQIETYERDVYKCERCGSNDIMIEE